MAIHKNYYHSGVSFHLDVWKAIDQQCQKDGVTRHGFIVAAVKRALTATPPNTDVLGGVE
jgi:hypothetical protein